MSTLPAAFTAPTVRESLDPHLYSVLANTVEEYHQATPQDLPLELITKYLQVPDDIPARHRVWHLEDSDNEITELFKAAHTPVPAEIQRTFHEHRAEIEFHASMHGM